jgi:hypothetical protein
MMLKKVALVVAIVGFWTLVPAKAVEQFPSGIWMSQSDLQALPTSGSAWNGLLAAANKSCGTPDLTNQEDAANVCVMAKALVFARTGQSTYRQGVVTALTAVAGAPAFNGRALALGRELAAYVIAADLIDLKNYNATLDGAFRFKIQQLLTVVTIEGPQNLIYCHEERPNNWGTHCGASRVAVAAYLGDTVELESAARVFKGWLGDRSAYSSFSYGDTSWQCNPNQPVGINPAGCVKEGHVIDGVLPDDQRRAEGFSWPPTQENYVYEALQGALVQAVILRRAGYTDVFEWQNRALLRAFYWLHTQNSFPAGGDDTWQPHVINHFYGSVGANFPAPIPSQPGKNVGWTDWTFQGRAAATSSPVLSVSPLSLSFTAQQGGANPAPKSVQVTNVGGGTLTWSASASAAEWLVSPRSGGAPGSFAVAPSISGLAPGTYRGTVTVTASGAQQSPATVQLTLTVSASETVSGPRTLIPVADAVVRGGSFSGQNFGTLGDLEVKDGGGNTYDRRALLKFDVRGLGVTSAVVKLYVSALPNGASVPVCVLTASDSWAEKTVTWSNHPAAIASLGCVTVKTVGWVTLDVTGFVKQERAGDGFVTFLLSDPTQTNRMARIHSRERTTNRPVLDIK